MFCAQGKAEYRQGFTRCADCDVDLVCEPPAAVNGLGPWGKAGARAEDSDDPFCSCWRGGDPRVHAEPCELRNSGGSPQMTIRRADQLFNMKTKTAFQIGISLPTLYK